MKGSKRKLTTEEKFAKAEKILKAHEQNPTGKKLFNNALKKAITSFKKAK